MDLNYLIALLGIIGIDILLAGDNAIVIALACRSLPEKQRLWGTILGTAAAVVLRIIFAVLITILLKVPLLKVVGGLLLFWIAVKLLTDDNNDHEIQASDKLWNAVKTIAIADAVMSLDNVIAITAMARGDTTLIILGILISIPLVIFGAQMIMKLLDKYPLLIWLGAALLGFLAGEMLVTDIQTVDWLAKLNPNWVTINPNIVEIKSFAWVNAVADWIQTTLNLKNYPAGRETIGFIKYGAGILGALFVIGAAYLLRNKKHA
jgi:YjbE family integral membrane protein